MAGWRDTWDRWRKRFSRSATPLVLDPAKTKALGGSTESGTPWSGARPTAEHLWELWANWPQTHEMMLRTDPVIDGAVQVHDATILSERWRFRMPDKPRDPEIAEVYTGYLNEAFGLEGFSPRLVHGWEAEHAKILPAVTLGYRYFGRRFYTEDGLIWPEKFADCDPAAHAEWIRSTRDPDMLAAIRQEQMYGIGGEPVPVDDLLVFSWRQRGSNFEGRGSLRAAYGYWRVKMALLRYLGMGVMRWVLPALKITVSDQTKYSDPDWERTLTNIRKFAGRYASGSTTWVESTDGIAVDIFGKGAFDPKLIVAAVRFCDQQILTALNLQHLMLGLGDVGSKNVGEVHASALNLHCANVNDWISGVITGRQGPGRGIVEQLLDWNFGHMAPLHRSNIPLFQHDGLIDPPLAKYVNHLAAWIQSNALTPTDGLDEGLNGLIGVEFADEARRPAAERVASTTNNSVRNNPDLDPGAGGLPANAGADADVIELRGKRYALVPIREAA